MSRQTLESGTEFAGYAIGRELGRGGMATVYLAEDLKHHRPVALKILETGLATSGEGERFLQEIAITATLTHPNILPLHDSGSADHRFYYVMPYVDGGSLRQRLDRDRFLPVDEAVQLCREVADALAYAHARGVVHRDIKPENIMLEQGHPVVVDFGVARGSALLGRTFSTGAGIALGTPAYMSPEQASGDSGVDHRADQYALACMLYEMLAGRPPFVGGGTREILRQHVLDPPPPLAVTRPGIPSNVREAVRRGLAKAATDRFESVREFADALVAPAQGATLAASVAVLPFVNLSATPEDTYFGEGMAEEITLALTRIEGLQVASRTSVFALQNQSLDIRTIGTRLEVTAVLEGSVRRSGDTLRVTTQLIDTADGFHRWSGRYDRQPRDVFTIHDDVATHVAQALGVHPRKDWPRPAVPAPTSDLEAYDYYLRGRQFFHQRRKKSVVFAQRMFTQATQRDPSYARAYAGLADACALLAHYYPDEGAAGNIRQADEASRKALDLDPDLAEARTARGFALTLLDRFAEAEEEFRRAVELDPHQFEAWYVHGRACFQRGELERALELFEEAIRVREDHEALYFAAQTLMALGRTREATAAYRRALPAFERHLGLNPDDARGATMAALCCSRLKDRTGALTWAEQATAVDPDDAGVHYNVACLLAVEGERERALDHIECAFQAGFAHRDWVDHDPDLESLRDDPRFQALVQAK